MVGGRQEGERIEDFLASQVVRRGLDERTAKAYRLDLEHLYQWLGENHIETLEGKAAEDYLDYLIKEKKLKSSTVTRKYRVFQYYLQYLARQGHLPDYRPIVQPSPTGQEKKTDSALSKAEIDAFFTAINREYENLDNDFRRRVCLRDSVIMGLLFYHGMEISELLRMEVSDYDPGTRFLSIRGKRGKRRTVSVFSKELREKLGRWIEERPYFEKENEWHNCMFLSKMGKPLSMKMIILIFDKYRALAGIEKESTPKNLKYSMKKYAQELLIERYS